MSLVLILTEREMVEFITICYSFVIEFCLFLTDSLKFTSGISILLAIVFVATSSAMAVYAMWQGKTQKIRLFPDFANQVSTFDLFTTIPVFVTSFGLHVNGNH